jgi:hypothetical protein
VDDPLALAERDVTGSMTNAECGGYLHVQTCFDGDQVEPA